MVNIETVMEGVRQCAKGECAGDACPYWRNPAHFKGAIVSDVSCETQLARDARDLMDALNLGEPRVMSEDEWRRSGAGTGWIEWRIKGDPDEGLAAGDILVRCAWAQQTVAYEDGSSGSKTQAMAFGDSRIWVGGRRPTTDEREAVAWK